MMSRLRKEKLLLFLAIVIKALFDTSNAEANEEVDVEDLDAVGVRVSGCSFPFVYKGQAYNYCTKAKSKYLWCSVDSEYQGRYRYCEKKAVKTDEKKDNYAILLKKIEEHDSRLKALTGSSTGCRCSIKSVFEYIINVGKVIDDHERRVIKIATRITRLKILIEVVEKIKKYEKKIMIIIKEKGKGKGGGKEGDDGITEEKDHIRDCSLRRSCYLFFKIRVTENDARFYCRKHGGILAPVPNRHINAWLASRGSEYGGGSYFIGLTDKRSEGRFVDSKGHNAHYLHFAAGEPDNLKQNLRFPLFDVTVKKRGKRHFTIKTYKVRGHFHKITHRRKVISRKIHVRHKVIIGGHRRYGRKTTITGKWSSRRIKVGGKWITGIKIRGKYGKRIKIGTKWTKRKIKVRGKWIRTKIKVIGGRRIKIRGKWGRKIKVGGRWGKKIVVGGRWGTRIKIGGKWVTRKIKVGGKWITGIKIRGKFGKRIKIGTKWTKRKIKVGGKWIRTKIKVIGGRRIKIRGKWGRKIKVGGRWGKKIVVGGRWGTRIKIGGGIFGKHKIKIIGGRVVIGGRKWIKKIGRGKIHVRIGFKHKIIIRTRYTYRRWWIRKKWIFRRRRRVIWRRRWLKIWKRKIGFHRRIWKIRFGRIRIILRKVIRFTKWGIKVIIDRFGKRYIVETGLVIFIRTIIKTRRGLVVVIDKYGKYWVRKGDRWVILRPGKDKDDDNGIITDYKNRRIIIIRGGRKILVKRVKVVGKVVIVISTGGSRFIKKGGIWIRVTGSKFPWIKFVGKIDWKFPTVIKGVNIKRIIIAIRVIVDKIMKYKTREIIEKNTGNSKLLIVIREKITKWIAEYYKKITILKRIGLSKEIWEYLKKIKLVDFDSKNDEDCVTMNSHNSFWSDSSCQAKKKFICLTKK